MTQPQREDGMVILSEVVAEPVVWIWRHRIPEGEITIIDGDPGIGKSTLGVEIAATISTGRDWCDGSPCPRGPVLLFSAEDNIAKTIRPRLEAAGADLTLVIANKTEVTLPDGVGYISAKVQKYQARAVIIDPFMAFLSGRVNSWKDQDVRSAMRPLQEMAAKHKVAVIIVRHLNKGSGGNAIYRGGGSIGIIGAARAGFLVEVDPDDENARILASVKSNLGPKPPALAFRLETMGGDVSRVVWLGQSRHTAGTLLAAKDDASESPASVTEAKTLLIDAFGTAESVDAKETTGELKKAGLSESTILRARQSIGIQARKSGFGSTGRWRWFAPVGGFGPKNSPEPISPA